MINRFAIRLKIFILKALRKIGFLKSRRLDLSLKIRGKKWKVPIIREIGFNNHQMDEFWMLDIFEILDFDKQAILLDIGANVGQSLLKWKSIYPSNPYYGFEVLPKCISYLNTLIHINNFNQSIIINKAISNASGTAILNLHFDDPTDRTASILKTDLKIKDQIKVETISLDDFLIQYAVSKSNLKLIKIDIEGAEEIVLNTMVDILCKQTVVVIVEILSKNYNKGLLLQLYNFIEANHYSWYQIIKRKNRLQYLRKIGSLDVNCPIEESDYVLFPNQYDLIKFKAFLKAD